MSELPQGPRVTLAGRPSFEPEYVEDAQPEGKAIPSGCIRRLQVEHSMCSPDCPGRQRDGGCAADLVRGLETWQFVIDSEGYWCLTEAEP